VQRVPTFVHAVIVITEEPVRRRSDFQIPRYAAQLPLQHEIVRNDFHFELVVPDPPRLCPRPSIVKQPAPDPHPALCPFKTRLEA